MIKSFGDSATEDFWSGVSSAKARKFKAIEKAAIQSLAMIEAAIDLADLKVPPGNRLEALKGNLAAYHSIRINSQWRITFRWTAGGAEEVSIVDYH